MDEKAKPHMVGINHVALEVGNIDEALAFYARIFMFELRGRGRGGLLSIWAISSGTDGGTLAGGG